MNGDEEAHYVCPACGALHQYKSFVGSLCYTCCELPFIERPRRKVTNEETRIARALELFGDTMLRSPVSVLNSYELLILAAIAKAGDMERRKLSQIYPLQCRMVEEWMTNREVFLRRYGFGIEYIIKHDYSDF